MVGCDLPAESGTNASAAACYQDFLALDKAIDLFHIDADRISAQEILYCNVF